MTSPDIYKEIINAQFKQIVASTKQEKQENEQKQTSITEQLKQNEDPLIKNYLMTELKLLNDKLKCYDQINAQSDELLQKILNKISKYLYVDLLPKHQELEQEATNAYRCGDNETLLEIYEEVKNEQLTLNPNPNHYKMVLIMLKEKSPCA